MTNGIQRSQSPETTHQTIQRPENWEKPCYNCYENKLMYDMILNMIYDIILFYERFVLFYE